MITRYHRWAAIALLAATSLGCSESDGLPREAISGGVTLDGQALPSGTIQFTPTDSALGVGGGATIQGGQFSIPRETGLVPGSYRVSIFSSSNKGGDATKGTPEGRGKARAASPSETIPAKYNSKSELTAEIKKGGGNNALQFPLVSK